MCQKGFIERESMRDFPVRTTNTEKAIPYPVKRPFAWSISPAIQTWNWWRIYDEDDGYSGTNMERPGFQRMLQDMRSGKIDCAISKDLRPVFQKLH